MIPVIAHCLHCDQTHDPTERWERWERWIDDDQLPWREITEIDHRFLFQIT